MVAIEMQLTWFQFCSISGTGPVHASMVNRKRSTVDAHPPTVTLTRSGIFGVNDVIVVPIEQQYG